MSRSKKKKDGEKDGGTWRKIDVYNFLHSVSAFAFWQSASDSSGRVHSVVKCELNFAQLFAPFLDPCHPRQIFVCSGSSRSTEAEHMKRGVPRCINSFAYTLSRGE